MTKRAVACTLWLLSAASVTLGAALSLSPDLSERLAVVRTVASVCVYRVTAQQLAQDRLDTLAAVAGVPSGTRFDPAHNGYSFMSDTARAGAFYDGLDGRYVCFRESKRDFSIETDFPADLNDRATALLARLTSAGERYTPSGMNAYVVQEPGRPEPWHWKRTYHFSRILDRRLVLGAEGAVNAQFNRAGAASLVELPAVTLSPEPLSDPVDPGTLPARLEALAAVMDTLVYGANTLAVRAITAGPVVSSYTTEMRDGVRYLVPSLSVLLECDVAQSEPVRRQRHFSLDRRSVNYGYGDPWLLR